MKHINNGDNEIIFHLLRDLPYFQPITNYYGIKVRSLDTDLTKSVIVRDVSTSPESYQLFLLTGTTTTEYLNEGVISMLPYGTWYAEVYNASGSTVSDIITSTVLWRGMITSSEE